MFQGDGDPIRFSIRPIRPALEPNLEVVCCASETQEEAFATRMITENQDAICHKASRFLVYRVTFRKSARHLARRRRRSFARRRISPINNGYCDSVLIW
jgi:hypothetical protein